MQMEDVLTLLGLAGGVYWLVNNVLSIAQQQMMIRKLKGHAAAK